MKIKEPKIKDIFEGKYIDVWEDEGCVFMSFPFVTINIPKESWVEFREDLRKLIKED